MNAFSGRFASLCLVVSIAAAGLAAAGAADRRLVVRMLLDHGADIDARDFRGRTAYRLAEGSKQSFYFQEFPETAALLAELGADTSLGLPGTVQERLRDVPAAEAHVQPPSER